MDDKEKEAIDWTLTNPARLARVPQFEHYHAMQALLREISFAASYSLGELQQRAQLLIKGMEVPKGATHRALKRAEELEAVALAYRQLAEAFGHCTPGGAADRALGLAIEALAGYERANLPAPRDPSKA